MAIKEIIDKNIWESFFEVCQEKTFLQSWNWGEFQKAIGNKIWRLGIFDKGKLIGTVLISKIIAKRGVFFLIQHGPNIKAESIKLKEQMLEMLLNTLRKIAQEEKASFVRIAPLWERNEENQKIFKKLRFRESPMHANAYEATWKLNILSSEEEILSGMRKTTRYLIRQAIKNEHISIKKNQDLESLEIYQKLNKEVSGRQRFVPFSVEYIENEFKVFSEENQALWLFGKYKEEITAGALLIFWQGICFYHQAASSGKFAKLPIPYLVLWEAIKEAKARNCKIFDFWGYVDIKRAPKHPWAGPTFFKMGFGGNPCQYLKTQDFPLSGKYWLIYAFEKVRSIKKGL
jgi:peptidoglycan pentaglycine glycine transferase (the first glycine)